MKDEYLKAYQQRIEEIKTLDVSPEEKRKLAADAKNEILDQYRTSYLKEKEEAAKYEAEETVIEENNSEPEVEDATIEENDSESEVDEVDEAEEFGEQAPEEVEAAIIEEDDSESEVDEVDETEEVGRDDIGSILNKLEEREERGEVGIDLDPPTEFMDPDALFSTMNLDDLFSSLGIEDDGEEDSDSTHDDEELAGFDDIFMDSDALFAGLLDDFDEVEDEVNAETILSEFDLDEETTELEQNEALSDDAALAFNMINEEATDDVTETVEFAGDEQLIEEDAQVVSVETDVEEVEELVEGVIIDEEATDDLSSEELDPETVNEIEELEKERERAQKLGAIELALLVVLIILVIIVVYLIIGV